MCLKTSDQTIKTATSPIFCYKSGDIHKGRIGPFNNNTYYKQLQPAREITLSVELDNTVSAGYHSFNYYRELKQEMRFAEKAIFVIPKGAQYVDGQYNNDSWKNRVSSTIVYVAPATFWNRMKLKLGLLKIS